ncbi:hypothetical protein AAC978_12285 [Desulfitobacterium sp. THU1]
MTDKLPDPFYEIIFGFDVDYFSLQLIFVLEILIDSKPTEASIDSIKSFSLSLIELPPSLHFSIITFLSFFGNRNNLVCRLSDLTLTFSFYVVVYLFMPPLFAPPHN